MKIGSESVCLFQLLETSLSINIDSILSIFSLLEYRSSAPSTQSLIDGPARMALGDAYDVEPLLEGLRCLLMCG